MRQFEQAIPAGIIMCIGLWVSYVSFTQQPAEAFAFPRLISALFVLFSIFVFARTLMGKGDKFASTSAQTWKAILPGLAVATVYVFWAAKALGFYTAATLAVFILISIYDPNPNSEVKTWVKRLVITAVFTTVMYLLFATLLGVFTPREFFLR